jgi:osmotically-inducible protein OsmY
MAIAPELRADADAAIQQDVLGALQYARRVAPSEVGVVVEDGVVTLTGWVDSYAKKWAAEEAAHRVAGVKAVANDIEVRLPSRIGQTDADLAAAVARVLEWDALLSIDRLDVTVSKGWVTLKGDVESPYQKHDAERLVRRLAGVTGVTNALAVKARLAPADLRQRIEEALVRTAELDAEAIEVEIDGSRIMLKGTVRSWTEREEAERQAWAAPGVTAVDNRIAIAF